MGQTRPTLLYPTALSLGSQLKVELVKNKRIEISKQWVLPYNLRIFRCYSEHWTIFMGTNLEELKQVFEIFSNLLNSKSLLPLDIKTKEILYFEFLNKATFLKNECASYIDHCNTKEIKMKWAMTIFIIWLPVNQCLLLFWQKMTKWLVE